MGVRGKRGLVVVYRGHLSIQGVGRDTSIYLIGKYRKGGGYDSIGGVNGTRKWLVSHFEIETGAQATQVGMLLGRQRFCSPAFFHGLRASRHQR